MSWPGKCIVDTNVPKTANLALQQESNSDVPYECVDACIEAIEHVINNGGLIIDKNGEIFDEYQKQLCLSGQPGMGDVFMKWVHDNCWSWPASQRVSITKNGDSYDEFPSHSGLNDFDRSDRKFIAVANAHPDKPPILQATNSKWWGWNDALVEVGINVRFLCPEYVTVKYPTKMKQ